MEAVRDLNHFSALVREARSSGPGVATNCYLLPDEIKVLTARQRLFWRAEQGGVIFLREEPAYYQLYFFIDPRSPGQFRPMRKPVLLELVYQETGQSVPAGAQTARWEAGGFSVFHTYRRMAMSAESAARLTPVPVPPDSPYRARGARREDMPEICRLWAGIVDPYTTATPADDALAELITREQIHCMADARDNVAAVIQAQYGGGSCTISHVAVDPAYRRQRLAARLMQYGMQQGVKRGVRKILLWVADDNIPARELYRSLGFACDGKVTVQLLFANTREEQDGWKS